MGRPIGPRKVHHYRVELKLTAVKLRGMVGVQVQTVTDALDIPPFMLSRWRKEVRDGRLRGRVRQSAGAERRAREIKRLQARARDARGGACPAETTTSSRPFRRFECQVDLTAALPAHLVRSERFPGCGHTVLVDAPAHALAVIRDFIVH